MTREELRQAAIDYLGKAFQGQPASAPPSHLVQAAVSIVLTEELKSAAVGSTE